MGNNLLGNGFYFESHSIVIRQPLDSDVCSGEWSGWYNSYSITKYNSHGVYPVTVDDEVRFIGEALKRKDCMIFAVIDKKTGNLIGNAALQNIDFINRRSNIAITIGRPLGISTAVEVYGLMLEHAFSRLNLNRVGDATHEKLSPLVKMLSVLGFKEEGRLRSYFLRDGVYSDAIQFAVMQKDYLALKAARCGAILFDTIDELNLAIVSVVKGASEKSA